MLNLQARVHLKKIKRARRIDQKFDGAGVCVADRSGNRHGRVGHSRPAVKRHTKGRRFLDHFLMPALNRAFPFNEWYDRTVLVGEHLDFDMAWTLQLTFEINSAIAKRRFRFRSRSGEGRNKPRRLSDKPHSFAAPTSYRLDEQRIADPGSEGDQLIVRKLRVDWRVRAGHDGNAGGNCRLARRHLPAH